jgi:hypothetical protein
MQPQEYRDTILEALNKIEVAQTRMFTAMVNVGMSGSLVDLTDAFDLGEVVNFEIEMFEDSGDVNLEIIIKLIKQMEVAKQSLMNLNAIDQDELDEVPPED